ncbi:class II aldolase/adducin family protein [Agrobacterium larrymoorei]|uniref:Class II aldolase/adducin family protein n=1 Tax=Agrobacterium larrymoorei TaxID=160699 RepID=A0AAF0HDP4_9HYPH|nr:class II aldolase/adducin family protein [Agrobacterium larrymoorei]WHA42615.1 class II aldolase/adducin family protein [Agrobacterium larrymoorei]
MNYPDARNQIIETVCRLELLGFNHGSSGNVSCRVDQDQILITPTGARSENLTPDRLVLVQTDGTTLSEGKPSSEVDMHLAVYNSGPTVGAVIHTHADACVALSCLAKPIPAFHYMIAAFGGDNVPCAEYATFGSPALAKSAAKALNGRTACLLANHGMIALGADLASALNRTIKLETLARQYILSCQAGKPSIIPKDEMKRVAKRYETYG